MKLSPLPLLALNILFDLALIMDSLFADSVTVAMAEAAVVVGGVVVGWPVGVYEVPDTGDVATELASNFIPNMGNSRGDKLPSFPSWIRRLLSLRGEI